MQFLWHLLLGGLAGFLAGKLMRGQGYGVIVDILLGFAGGFVGGWLGGVLGLPSFGFFITAFLGAVLLVWVTRLLTK